MTQQSIEIGLQADEAAAGIASPFGLAIWLADECRVELKDGGRISLWWHNGDRASGRWSRYAPPDDLEMSFDSRPDHLPQQLRFRISPLQTGSRITAGGDADVDALLENLRVYLETGVHHRERQRPVIGVAFEVVDPSDGGGIRITDLADGGGAQAAGLQPGDVITTMQGQATTDWASLAAAMNDLTAGTTVEVGYRRGDSDAVAEVTLGERSVPSLPATPDQVASMAREGFDAHQHALDALLTDATEEEARFRPDGEWSVKETMAHVVAGERFSLGWVASALQDHPQPDWPGWLEEPLRRLYQSWPLADVQAAYRLALRERLDMLEEALSDDVTARKLHTVAADLHYTLEHLDEHIPQIRQTLEQARQSDAN